MGSRRLFRLQTCVKMKTMQTYTILQPLRSLTPSLILGGVNAPCESEPPCQHRLV